MEAVCIVGLLLPDIDEEKTIKNVKNYFEHEFPRLIAQSHMSLTYVQSPSFDCIGSGINTRNTQEDKIVGKLGAKEYIQITMKLISNCPHDYMVILKNYYIHNMTNIDLQELLGYGQTRCNELKNMALLYFADAFIDYYDLHVYIPENKKSDVMPTY
ncbi:hypothetical protein FC68_GL001104 [Companilactobacillus farciminis KCTC 3681 = DSM 20184]|nr:hypothetical protein FC68_GL001104 [Companilactobacillus farciminis KCTC 3681 = DSM 20184]